MNVGFYYHLEFVRDADGKPHVPSHFGVLLRGIAEEAGHVTFFGHAGPGAGNEDDELPGSLVTVIDLGPARSTPARTFNPKPALRNFRPHDQGVDVVLIQGPTPLLPHIARASGDIPVALLLGGDYRHWQRIATFPWWRNEAIRLWVRLYTAQQRRTARGRLVIVQNPLLAQTVSNAEIEVVPITSVSASALPAVDGRAGRWDGRKGTSEPVRLLYAGRINRGKGLFEAVEAVRMLEDRGYDTTLDLVGWEEPGDPNIDALMGSARDLGIGSRVRFLGYRAGAELIRTYEDADIFVIPTHWDSLPRSMHEAMAVGLPTIATPVGGIGYYLRDRETALLVEPKSARAIADAVELLIDDPELRIRIAERGQTWARGQTIETNCRDIVGALDRLVGPVRENLR